MTDRVQRRRRNNRLRVRMDHLLLVLLLLHAFDPRINVGLLSVFCFHSLWLLPVDPQHRDGPAPPFCPSAVTTVCRHCRCSLLRLLLRLSRHIVCHSACVRASDVIDRCHAYTSAPCTHTHTYSTVTVSHTRGSTRRKSCWCWSTCITSRSCTAISSQRTYCSIRADSSRYTHTDKPHPHPTNDTLCLA